jgi:hypothetical protein
MSGYRHRLPLRSLNTSRLKTNSPSRRAANRLGPRGRTISFLLTVAKSSRPCTNSLQSRVFGMYGPPPRRKRKSESSRLGLRVCIRPCWGIERPRAWMECASLWSYLSSRSSKTLTESRFPERRLDRGAISFFASRPGRKLKTS